MNELCGNRNLQEEIMAGVNNNNSHKKYSMKKGVQIFGTFNAVFLLIACFVTVNSYDSAYWLRPWFALPIILIVISICCSLYYGSYTILITDAGITQSTVFFKRVIMFRDIASIIPPLVPANKSKKFIITNNMVTIKIPIQTIMKDYMDLYADLRKLTEKYGKK